MNRILVPTPFEADPMASPSRGKLVLPVSHEHDLDCSLAAVSLIAMGLVLIPVAYITLARCVM